VEPSPLIPGLRIDLPGQKRTHGQVIYPLARDEAASAEEGESQKRVQLLDDRLDQLMGVVRLRYLLQRQGGWDSVAEWQDVLSLGRSLLLVSMGHPLTPL